MKLRTASESVGSLNSEGPLTVSPTVPSAIERELQELREAHAALVADMENLHRILGDSTKSLNERGADASVAVRAALTRSKESH